jgi:putative ATPase
MERQAFYQPTNRGFEAKVAERIAYWDEMRLKRAKDDPSS